ncbi:MAG: MFS transporter, partial [Algoriphagus sp.]|nr:MFS transporter [Algoriphagus sp.]
MTQEKKKLSFWQIWNMSFGFLGIQFGFALQGGFMSRIFQTLGADKDAIPLLWIAAPLTGLIVQPIVGYLSDRTWHPKFGRRKPFFFLGAVFSTVALFFAPYSAALWMAAGALWILDASINISMEPFRALVADKLPESQRSYGFVVQTLIIGIGTWIASNLPWLMTQLGAANTAEPGIVPESVKYAFALGAVVLFSSILYTILTTEEYPPEDLSTFEKEKSLKKGFLAGLKDIVHLIATMPTVMKQLGLVQFFSWFAFFTMWSFATPAITEHIFGATDPSSAAYNNAADRVGNYLGTYGLVSMFFALILSIVASKVKINRKLLHMGSLFAGGLGFILIYFIQEPWM